MGEPASRGPQPGLLEQSRSVLGRSRGDLSGAAGGPETGVGTRAQGSAPRIGERRAAGTEGVSVSRHSVQTGP